MRRIKLSRRASRKMFYKGAKVHPLSKFKKNVQRGGVML